MGIEPIVWVAIVTQLGGLLAVFIQNHKTARQVTNGHKSNMRDDLSVVMDAVTKHIPAQFAATNMRLSGVDSSINGLHNDVRRLHQRIDRLEDDSESPPR